MRAAVRGPTARPRTPQPAAALAILDAALRAARAALRAEHPDAGPRGRHAAPPARLHVPIAARVVERITELRHLLTRYRQALDAVHPDHDRRQAELPF